MLKITKGAVTFGETESNNDASHLNLTIPKRGCLKLHLRQPLFSKNSLCGYANRVNILYLLSLTPKMRESMGERNFGVFMITIFIKLPSYNALCDESSVGAFSGRFIIRPSHRIKALARYHIMQASYLLLP